MSDFLSITKPQSRYSSGLQSSQGPTRRGSTSKLTHVPVDRLQILTGYCWEILVPCHVDLFIAENMAAGLCQRELLLKAREGSKQTTNY